MSDTLAKITNILLWVLIAVSAVFISMLFIDGSDSWISNSLSFAFILTGFAGLVALGFGIFTFVLKFFNKPKSALISLIPIVALIAIIIFAYSYASGAAMEIPNYKEVLTSSTIKWSGAGLIVTYLLFILAVASIFFVEFAKFFKK